MPKAQTQALAPANAAQPTSPTPSAAPAKAIAAPKAVAPSKAAPATKPAAKPAKPSPAADSNTTAKITVGSALVKTPKVTKPAKPSKLVRDSFTMPASEYAHIDALKQRLAAAGRPCKKSELIRAGFAVLTELDTQALVRELNALELVKLGRKKK